MVASPDYSSVDLKDRDALNYTYLHRSLKNCSIGVPPLAGQPPAKTFDVHILPGKLRPCEVYSPALFTATPEKVFKEPTTKRKSKMGKPVRSKRQWLKLRASIRRRWTTVYC